MICAPSTSICQMLWQVLLPLLSYGRNQRTISLWYLVTLGLISRMGLKQTEPNGWFLSIRPKHKPKFTVVNILKIKWHRVRTKRRNS